MTERIASFPSTVETSIDVLALQHALNYAKRTYGTLLHITSVTSFANGACRIEFDAFSPPSNPSTTLYGVSVFGQANGDVGE